MKRFFSLLLAPLLLLSLVGCGNTISDQTNFYYCNVNYQFGDNNSVIVSETRDITSHKEDVPYLISLYLAGPSSKKLESPFPKNTKLISVETNSTGTTVELSNLERQLSDAEFILACACLTLSTMEFTYSEQVTIISGSKTITMDRNDLMLYDTITAETVVEETE